MSNLHQKELTTFKFPISRSQDTEVLNEEVGHLLRTKDSHDNEGGVAAGFATIDTPFLIS